MLFTLHKMDKIVEILQQAIACQNSLSLSYKLGAAFKLFCLKCRFLKKPIFYIKLNIY